MLVLHAVFTRAAVQARRGRGLVLVLDRGCGVVDVERGAEPADELLELLHLGTHREETHPGASLEAVDDAEAESDGSRPILVCGEEAGLDLPYGCREGICHTCVGTLRKGRVRDLRNGTVCGQEGQPTQTCINAPEGPVEIEL